MTHEEILSMLGDYVDYLIANFVKSVILIK